MRIVVVGASLGGTSAAIALARDGHAVTVLERALQAGTGGAGLGIDRGLLQAVTGADPHDLPVIATNRESTQWMLIHDWLHAVARRHPDLRIERGVEVLAATVDGDMTTRDGRITADVVVGADGHRSVIRRAIDPAHADAGYAGYLLWRGLVDERALPSSLRGAVQRRVTVLYAENDRLVAYFVPGARGETAPGTRAISFAWYDRHRDDLLRQLGCLDGNRVLGTLAPDVLPRDVRDALIANATRLWPSPWRDAVVHALATDRCFGTPIAEYVPRRLVHGRLAMLGDAAHVASPMTGSGLHFALLDALALADALRDVDARDAPTALARYEHARLDDDRALAESGRRWSADYLRR